MLTGRLGKKHSHKDQTFLHTNTKVEPNHRKQRQYFKGLNYYRIFNMCTTIGFIVMSKLTLFVQSFNENHIFHK